ncbi:unnamed protein product, partial [Effrenium voratum]
VCAPGRLKRGNLKERPFVSAGATLAPDMERLQEEAATARNISELEFWSLVNEQQVEEVIIASWSGKQLLAKKVEGELVAVQEESEVEDLREQLLLKGVPVHYPAGEALSEEEALAKA